MKQRGLIITVAVNYNIQQLKIFINSALYNCPSFDLYIFCDRKVRKDLSKYYRKYLERFYFKEFDFYTEYRIKKNKKIFHSFTKMIALLMKINNLFAFKNNINSYELEQFKIGKYTLLSSHFLLRRFIWYLNIDINLIHKYDYLLLSDCRDVYFQNDPFKSNSFGDEFIVTGYEPELIKHNIINKRWLTEAYKNDPLIYKQLGNSKIICAGVTFGSKSLIFDYLQKMGEEIKKFIFINKSTSITNLDQIFHNKIFHYEDKKNYCIDGSDKFISTIGFNDKFDIRVDKSNKKIFINDKLPSIIHQYDRNKLLTDLINSWIHSYKSY